MSGKRNIFPLGKIVSSDDVVDREQFIKETKLRLMHGNSVMLSGPRRIGKSSVAYEILRQLQFEGCYIAHVDLFYVTSIEELATKLIQSVLENRTGVIQQVSTAVRHLKGLFSKAEIHAKIHDLELGITLESQTDPVHLLETAFVTAERLAVKDDKRIVILLDEFQELDRLGKAYGGLLKRLRSIFQQQTQTCYFFLGSESSVLNTIFADRRQAFYRFATLLDLPQIPFHEWEAYIRGKLAPTDITITEQAVNMLLERTGGHPYCMMSVMNNAYITAEANNLGTIDAELLLAAYEHSLVQLNAVYDEQWHEIRRAKGADAVLIAILLDDPIYTKANANANRSVQKLIRLSVIKKGIGRGKYELTERMFGDWLLRRTNLSHS